MSSAIYVAEVAGAAASAAMAISLSLKVTAQDDAYTIDRTACHSFYMFAVLLTGLIFSLVVARVNPQIMMPMAIGWVIAIGFFVAEIILLYRAKQRGHYANNEVVIVTWCNHAIVITAACMSIVYLILLARRELGISGKGE